MYLEPENVTVVSNTWAVQNNFNYLYQQKSDGSLAVPPIGKNIYHAEVELLTAATYFYLVKKSMKKLFESWFWSLNFKILSTMY